MKRQAFALAFLLPLAGCAVGPDYARPDAAVPQAYKGTGEWKVAQPRDEEIRGKWWEIFGDAQLSALVEQVEISNQNVLLAGAQFRRAQALIAASRSSLFPTVGASVSAVRSQSPAGVAGGTTTGRINTNRTASLDAGWEVDLWGQFRRSVEASEAGAQASWADLAAARLSAQAELATSYFLLRTIDTQRRLLDDTVATFQKQLELTNNRYAAGVVAKVDVAQAQTQLRSTQADAIDLGVQRAQLENAIAVLVGRPPAELSIAPAPLDVAMPLVPPAMPSELLERRPDVAAAERRMAAANAQVGVAKAAYFPSLTISATGGYSSADPSQWFTAPARFWAIGPAIAQSIFDAGLRRAQTDEAIAAYDATVAAYRQTVLSGFREVEDSLAALRILEQEAKVQEDAVRAARETVALTLNQYKAGTVSFLNVAIVQASQLNNERTAVGILGRRLVAAVSLVRALGGGWSASELPEGELLRTRSSPPEAAR